MWHAIEFLIGLFIVLTVCSDVFATVLVPRATARRARVGPLVNGLMAPLWRHSVRWFHSKRERQNVQGSLGPAILVTALAAWVLGLSFGFALMLHSMPDDVSIDRFGFGEALFQSALAISTLGMIHADIDGWARAVVAVEGVGGFSILTLTLAFLLQVQDALHRRESLVLTFVGRAGRPPSATRLLRGMAGADDAELAALFERWETWAAEVMQSHLSYPVLFRFRSLDADGEWLACLGTVLDAAALVRAAAPAGFDRTQRQAGYLAATAGRALHEFARVLRLPHDPPLRDQGNGDDLAAFLTRHGFAPSVPGALDERLRALRADYAGLLPRIADRLDLAWSDTLIGRDPGRTSHL